MSRRLVIAVALAPMALFVVTRLGERMWLLSDSAAIDLTARDALHGDLPLVGVYSRFGWQHPGPFLFYWLAPFIAISKGHAWGGAVGGAVLQALAVVMVIRITSGRGLRWMVAGVASILFTLVALGDDGLTIPWNPHVAAAWFVVLVWSTWSIVAEARTSSTGWWLVVASIVVQTHVGFTPLVMVCALWVAAAVMVAWRRRTLERPSWPSVALFVLMWVPVLADQVGGSGNLHSLARLAVHPSGATVGLRRAAGMVASAFRAPPAWLTGQLHVDPFSSDVSRASVAWLALALAIVAVVAWRSRDAATRVLLAIGASLIVASVIAVAQIRDGAYAYVMSYVPAVAAVTAAAVVLALSHWRRAVALVLAVAVLWGSAMLTRDVVARDGLNDRAQRDFESLLAQLPRHPGRVLLRSTGGFATLYFGMVDELDRAGVDVRVDPIDADKFGDKRVGDEHDVDQLWYVSESGADTDILLARFGTATVDAYTTPLSGPRELELSARRQGVAAQLRAAGRADLLTTLSSSLVTVFLRDVPGVDQALVADLADRNREVERSGRCQCAVISVPVRG